MLLLSFAAQNKSDKRLMPDNYVLIDSNIALH